MPTSSVSWRHFAFLWLISGCTAELHDPDLADNDAVLDHVEALGLAREDAVISGDHVVVEGDMRFDRSALFRGEYERLAPLRGDGELIEKGYHYPSLIAAKHQGNIRLRFAEGAYAPPKEVRDAFVVAAKSWSSVPGSAIRISPDNTGPAVVVRFVPAEDFDDYSGCADTDACAEVPLNGRPGYNLFVRSESTVPGCPDWTGSNAANMARHELGHSLGFAHPKAPKSDHAVGTQRCPYDDPRQCYRPGYSTVMGALKKEPGCIISPARLTKDDYKTCAAAYPAE
jgi:hypothetical protein